MELPSAPLRPVFVATVTCCTFGALYGLLGVAPGALPGVLIFAVPAFSVLRWIHEDARLGHWRGVQDVAFIGYVLYPAFVPWYVLKTRGGRAWRLALLLLAAPLAPLALLGIALLWRMMVKRYVFR